MQLMRNYLDNKEYLGLIDMKSKITWKPNLFWGILLGGMLLLSLLSITEPNPFLYFEF
jgi:hypothetical protein